MNDVEGQSDSSSPQNQAKPLTDEERLIALKRQVEYYFSRKNLMQDSYLLSKMDSDHFVDLSVIAEFKMIKQLTSDLEMIISSVKDSDKVVIDEAKKRIKPAATTERTTLILRNIPSNAAEESVRELLSSVNIPAFLAIRSDVGDNWFVTFETQELTKSAMDLAKGLKWEGKSIGCAIKCESLLKGLALMPPVAAIPFTSNCGNVNTSQNLPRPNGRRGNVSGRRNPGFQGKGSDEKQSSRVSSACATRDRKVKGKVTGTSGKQPNAQKDKDVVQAAVLKLSDFPVLGSPVVRSNGSSEADSAASTPPCCSSPPLTNGPASVEALPASAPTKKMSYAQMALSTAAPKAASPAAPVTATA